MTVEADDIRRVALSLPRAYEALVRDQVKFRVGQLVFVALSRDERTMGVGFPKEQREAAVAAEPEKFAMPSRGDMRYRWIHVRLDALDPDEMRELVVARGRCACRRGWPGTTSRPRISESTPGRCGSCRCGSV